MLSKRIFVTLTLYVLAISSCLEILAYPIDASSKATVGKFAFHFVSKDQSKQWMAKAYQGSFEEYLGGFSNLNLVAQTEIDAEGTFKNCVSSRGGFFDCGKISASQSKLSFNFVVLGLLQGKSLEYKIFEKQTGANFADGSLDVDSISTVKLQVGALQVFKPFIKPGGIIDQVLAEDKKLLTLDLPAFLLPYIPKLLVGGASSLLALLGGISWGILLILLGRFCIGSLNGVDRISSDSVARFVRAWLEIFILKFLGIALLLLPSLLLGFFFIRLGFITDKFFWLFLLPTLGLLSVVLLLVLSWIVAEVLERLYLKKINVPAWNDKIKKYYQSYAQRLGVTYSEELLQKIRFTAGNTKKVMCVGGGLVETTVIIPQQMAILALDEVDLTGEEAEGRDPKMPLEMRSIIAPEAILADKFLRESEDSYDISTKECKKILEGAGVEAQFEGESSNKLEVKREINQQAGVWGYVLPRIKDKSIPLISDTADDLEVVDELIREHHVQYYKPQMEEVFDDLDSGNRDFLFGVLVQKIAMIDRWEHVLCNFHHVINNFTDGSRGAINFIPRIIRAFYQANLSRYYDRLNDHSVMFNQGHHHLIQYYFFLLKGRKRELTQRASGDKLISTTNKITTWLLENPADPKEESSDKLEIRSRLTELSYFANLYVPRQEPEHFFPWRKVGLASAALLAIGIQTSQAFEFSPVYEKRQADLDAKIKEFKEKEDQRLATAEKAQTASAEPAEQPAKPIKPAAPTQKSKAKPKSKSTAKPKINKNSESKKSRKGDR